MGLETIIKFGYALVIITLSLMIWVSLSSAYHMETEQERYPPCTYNALCTCSKSAPDLGIVRCRNVPFPALPKMVNNSKVFSLSMENTGLRDIEPYYLQATGMYRLKISENHLTEIPDDAFTGLERSLWELMLPYNDLIEIPSKSFRHLHKLRHLDVSYNHITHIHHDSFRGLEDSLQTLVLKENCISRLESSSFSGLLILETLDLSGNNLFEIDPSVFRDGMPRLHKLLLTDNILSEIPYDALATLKALRTLDISHNVIWSMAGNETYQTKSSAKLNLDNLHIEYNHIKKLTPNSFKNFEVVNRTFFDGNPIYRIMEDAFKPAKIREIYMRYCGLTRISPVAFDSLVNSLQILDLSGNNITNLPNKLFNNFDTLRVLSLRDNKIKIIAPVEMFNVVQYSLLKLDLSGDMNSETNLQELRKMRNMRSLSLSKMKTNSLDADEFSEFGVELEDLQITRGGLTNVKAHAFKNVRGLKRLDLSENGIGSIESDAFNEIGHSLISLKIAHGFTGSALPAEALRHLTSLQELDFSNNQIASMSDTSLHFLKNLRLLELHDNRIEQVAKGTFQGDIHSKLEEISFKFNNLGQISQHTFFDLEALRKLYLDDNKISNIERRAFMNLDQLVHLSIRGNKLNNLAEESFQNLPKLEMLDMAFNSLPNFAFDYFDQVGTLSSLSVNVSHNKIFSLMNNSTWGGRSDHGSIYHSNIKNLDLSHNNISIIHPGYFRPVEMSLTHLHLGYNALMNSTRDIFGNFPHLQWLDISHNYIREVDFDAFKNTKNLQVLYLSYNQLTDLPQDTFKPFYGLRIIDLSHNYLKSLPDNLFVNGGLERMDVSHNHLLKIPTSSLSSLAALTLCELHLSNNYIATIHSMDLSNKFRTLKYLDISYNYLLRIDDAVFATLPRLTHLDLSHNRDLRVMDKSFLGLENTLIKLGLENVSLSTVPEMRLKHLRELRLASNELPSIPPEMAHNMSALRLLDLSNNDLTNVPIIAQHLPQLRILKLSGNPITSLTNNSFDGVNEDLEMLDISHFRLHFFENGSLESLPNIRSLKISAYSHLPSFNIPYLLKEHHNIRELWVEAPKSPEHYADIIQGKPISENKKYLLDMGKPTDLEREMRGHLPSKLTNITFSGPQFTTLGETILRGMRSPYIYIQLFNTSISAIPTNFFKNMGRVRNVSIDVRYNNNELKTIPNPNTGAVPYLPHSVFLTDIKMSGSKMNCDCNLGWVEFWQRKRRQYICSSQTWTDTVFRTFMNSPCQIYGKHDCEEMDDDLRETQCSNKNNEQLMEILKSDLECGWDSAPRINMVERWLLISSTIFLLIFWL
ncbi:chaoptin isoform X2 [Condylostylus longicornis]|uniref:chaoptin isoform X2 n=1 Tax=Condylostylus longicornis TaxID=2530218 RepID=UPI00244E2285|nr:chaoptin isoform X2 [Condylostylus longicornis]